MIISIVLISCDDATCTTIWVDHFYSDFFIPLQVVVVLAVVVVVIVVVVLSSSSGDSSSDSDSDN